MKDLYDEMERLKDEATIIKDSKLECILVFGRKSEIEFNFEILDDGRLQVLVGINNIIADRIMCRDFNNFENITCGTRQFAKYIEEKHLQELREHLN